MATDNNGCLFVYNGNQPPKPNLATDNNGCLFVYNGNQPPKPNLDNGCFTVIDDITFIAQLEFEGDWTKSVTNVE
jgi:hypothetical protein